MNVLTINRIMKKDDTIKIRFNADSFQSKLSSLKVHKFPEMLGDVGILFSLWRQISDIVKDSTDEGVRIYVESLCEKTKEFTMHEDWRKVVPPIRDHLVTLARDLKKILSKNTAFSQEFRNIIWELMAIAVEPWENPLVLNLLKKDCNLDAVDEYFTLERGRITFYRLRLILSRVKQTYQFVFVTYFVGNILKACERNKKIENMLATDGLNYIVDAYLVGLFNISKTEDQLAYIRRMSFENIHNLHKRYMADGIGFLTSDAEKTFWQHSEHVINTVNHNLLLRILGLDLTESKNFDLLEDVLTICIEREDLTRKEYQRSIWCALTCYGKSSNVRQFNKLFIKKLQNRENLKSFGVTFLIKEIVTTINELERYKFTSNKELVDQSRRNLSESYLFVCQYFHDNVEIRKEAILAAFNINPTESNYQSVVTMASTVKMFEKPSGISNQKRCGDSIGMLGPSHSYETRSRNSNRKPIGNLRWGLKGNSNEKRGGDLNEKRRGQAFGKNNGDSNRIPSRDLCGMSRRNSNGKPGGDLNEKPKVDSVNSKNKDTDLDESLLRDLTMAVNYDRHYSLKWSMDWDALEYNCMEYMANFEDNNAEK